MSLANLTDFNSTQGQNNTSHLMAIIWFTAIGISGLTGNVFVIAVTSSRSHLKSTHMVIIWLGCIDLIGCLILPLRYKTIYQTEMSPTVCVVIQFVTIFVHHLNIFTLVMVAIERHKTVKNVSNSRNTNDKKDVIELILGCIFVAVIIAISFVMMVVTFQGDRKSCILHPDSHGNIRVILRAARQFAAVISICIFIVITVFYLKISKLIRQRTGPQPQDASQQSPSQVPNHNRDENNVLAPVLAQPLKHTGSQSYSSQQFASSASGQDTVAQPRPHSLHQVKSLSVQSLPENAGNEAAEGGFSWWVKVLSDISQLQDNEEFYRDVSDPVSFQFIDLEFTEEASSSNKLSNRTASPEPSLAACPTASVPQRRSELESHVLPSLTAYAAASGPRRQFELESDILQLNCEDRIPEVSTANQLPGIVMDKHDDEMVIPTAVPVVRNIILQDSTVGNPGPVIPELNNQDHHTCMSIQGRVTLVLFIAPLVYFVTYGVLSLSLLSDNKTAITFCRHFILVNHAINPVIYSVINKGFREDTAKCICRMKQRFGY